MMLREELMAMCCEAGWLAGCRTGLTCCLPCKVSLLLHLLDLTWFCPTHTSGNYIKKNSNNNEKQVVPLEIYFECKSFY